MFYGILQNLEAEFRRRNGRATTVDSWVMEFQSEATASTDLSDSHSSDVATFNDQNRRIKPVLVEEPDDDQLASTALAIPPQKKRPVDSELIEKLLQEETDRVRCF